MFLQTRNNTRKILSPNQPPCNLIIRKNVTGPKTFTSMSSWTQGHSIIKVNFMNRKKGSKLKSRPCTNKTVRVEKNEAPFNSRVVLSVNLKRSCSII